MENIFKAGKRGIIATLTLCMLLGIAGTCLSVTAMAATATVEETAVSTENATVVIDETIQELVPMMARGCEDDYSNIIAGKPDVPDDCTRVRNDVVGVKSPFFIEFVIATFGSYRANEWKKHMETWEDDDGNRYECHYWQGPNGVTYYHN